MVEAMGGPEWLGAQSRWHIQGHQRDPALGGPGPQGPAHWPRRPHDVGGFCDSVVDGPAQGRRRPRQRQNAAARRAVRRRHPPPRGLRGAAAAAVTRCWVDDGLGRP